MECAKVCHSNAECVGFEYNPSTKDCYLTKTIWRKKIPTGISNWWACEKKDGEYKIRQIDRSALTSQKSELLEKHDVSVLILHINYLSSNSMYIGESIITVIYLSENRKTCVNRNS